MNEILDGLLLKFLSVLFKSFLELVIDRFWFVDYSFDFLEITTTHQQRQHLFVFHNVFLGLFDHLKYFDVSIGDIHAISQKMSKGFFYSCLCSSALKMIFKFNPTYLFLMESLNEFSFLIMGFFDLSLQAFDFLLKGHEVRLPFSFNVSLLLLFYSFLRHVVFNQDG